ncbi:hypothetical protein [Nonomuraea sediminis]|uniref:hypothetical protein n=1 Tax=Nonomuraea sediminis TaxID=2835864 RepID=UPI001BDD821A|nr:hypothetical protein [Nonomuraea sediminis]
MNSVRGRERERFSLAGGEVVVYDCEDPADARWATWIGPWNMAHGLFYDPEWESRDIVEAFTRVTWNDTPEGLTADPGKRFQLSLAFYLTTVAGVGTMRVEPKQQGVERIPQWRGYRAESGEMWRMDPSPSGQEAPFMLVTDTAIATLFPWDAPRSGQPSLRASAGSAETAAQFLSKVKRVDWQA